MAKRTQYPLSTRVDMLRYTPRKRPSELLDLNKASTATKRMSAESARNSPLLSMPPEIRSCIWDLVFHVGSIHISKRHDWRPNSYHLSICQCANDNEETALHIVLEQSSDDEDLFQKEKDWMAGHRKCLSANRTSLPLQRALQLDLLRTSRLIYHEIVLRPFSSNTFQCSSQSGGTRALQNLFYALASNQVTAIKHMHFTSVDARYEPLLILERFKGLQHLNIQICLSRADERPLNLFSESGVPVLRRLPLRSLRVSVELELDSTNLTDSKIVAQKTWVEEMEGSIRDLDHET